MLTALGCGGACCALVIHLRFTVVAHTELKRSHHTPVAFQAMLRPPSQPGSHASRPTAYLPPAAGPGSTGVSNTMRAMACSSNHRHALSSNHMGAAQWRRATAAVPQQVPAPPTQLQAPTSSPSANHIVSGPRHTSAASGPAARAQLSTEQQEANTTGTHQASALLAHCCDVELQAG
jgi:hypothetical protein